MNLAKTLLATCLLFASSVPAFAVGAIAISDSGGRDPGYGYSVRLPSREQAERVAVRKCRERNESCRVVVWFETCGAYATSRERSGIGYGRSQGRAEDQAMDACGSRGCHVVISACE